MSGPLPQHLQLTHHVWAVQERQNHCPLCCCCGGGAMQCVESPPVEVLLIPAAMLSGGIEHCCPTFWTERG